VTIVKRRRPAPDVPRESSWWEQAQGRQVMLHMTDENTMRGLVSVVVPDGVLLASPEYLHDGADPVTVAGEAFIPAERVLWVQMVPGGTPRSETAKETRAPHQ